MTEWAKFEDQWPPEDVEQILVYSPGIHNKYVVDVEYWTNRLGLKCITFDVNSRDINEDYDILFFSDKESRRCGFTHWAMIPDPQEEVNP